MKDRAKKKNKKKKENELIRKKERKKENKQIKKLLYKKWSNNRNKSIGYENWAIKFLFLIFVCPFDMGFLKRSKTMKVRASCSQKTKHLRDQSGIRKRVYWPIRDQRVGFTDAGSTLPDPNFWWAITLQPRLKSAIWKFISLGTTHHTA